MAANAAPTTPHARRESMPAALIPVWTLHGARTGAVPWTLMDPDDLLAGPAAEAAVAALAERNRHHLEQMSDAEREDALGHWRELAITVLTAARSAAGTENGDAVPAHPH